MTMLCLPFPEFSCLVDVLFRGSHHQPPLPAYTFQSKLLLSSILNAHKIMNTFLVQGIINKHIAGLGTAATAKPPPK